MSANLKYVRHLYLSIMLFAAAAMPLRAQTAGFDILIPHLAAGGGYTSLLYISDPIGIVSRQVEISYFDNTGSPLPVSVDGAPASASTRLTLSRFEERSLTLTSTGNSLLTGWVRIAVDRGSKLYASLRFLFGGSGVSPSDAVGILPSGVQKTWYVVAERRTAEDYTGIAVANPNGFPIEVEFNFYQGPNRVPGTTSVRRTLAPLGHMALFTHELFPVNFSGVATLEIYGVQGNLAAAALHGDGVQYSALPAHPAVEMWDFSVTDTGGGTVEKGTWCWKYNESAGFHGVASLGERRVDLRGSFEGNRFELVRFAATGDATGADLHIYQGNLEVQGDRTLLRGRRLEIGGSGVVLRTSDFTATRLP